MPTEVEKKQQLTEDSRATKNKAGQRGESGKQFVGAAEKVQWSPIGSEMQPLLDAIPFYVMVVTDSHEILLANKAVRKALGVEPKRIIGRYCPQAIHGLDGPFPGCPVEEAAKKGQGIEREFFNPDTGRWVISMAYPIAGWRHEDRPVFLHFTRDITEEKQRMEENRRNLDTQRVINELLKLSLEDLPLEVVLSRAVDLILSIPWLVLESKGCIFLVEEGSDVLAMSAQKGLSEEIRRECARLPFGKCMCGRAALKGEMQFSDCLDHRHDIRYEGMEAHGHYCVPIRVGDKTLGLVNTYVKAGHIRDSKEEEFLTSIANALAGIIQGKRSAKALRDAENRFNAIFDNARDGILLADIETKTFHTGNRMICEMTGYSSEEIKNLDVADIHPGKDMQYIFEMYGKLADDEIDLATDIPVKRRDGTLFYADVKSFPITLEGKRYLVGIFRDRTGHKRTEEELRKAEAQLRQAQKMAAIGTLAGGIAHDFNNILTVILGNAEIALCDVPEGSPVRSSVDQVLEATHRAKDLVAQILTFSRQTEQERKPMKIGIIAKESLKFMRATLPATIETRIEIAADQDIVLADPTQIHQVLINLCTNAYHAMMEEGGVLEVGLSNVVIDSEAAARHPDLNAGPYLKMSVSDTGSGMTHQMMDHIFEPYFTTKAQGVGTGLGLAVVHGIVTSLGGDISVASEPGKGSIFDVLLPLAEEKIQPEPQTYEALPEGKERILFVDDEEAIAVLGKKMLERLGYEAVVRTNSIEALEAFKARPDKFDLVVADRTMPNMTGDTLARELWAIRPGIPVILCTGYSEGISEMTAKEMGIRALVRKPFLMKDLAKTIRQVLDTH